MSTTPSLPALPRARLFPYARGLLICPQFPDDPPASQAIRLPRIPEFVIDRVKQLCRRFAAENGGRAIIVLLILDLSSQMWGVQIPSQRCAADGVAWTLQSSTAPVADGLATSPDFERTPPRPWVIAGSFQLIPTRVEALSDHVPPIDGVHFLMRDACDAVEVVLVVGGRPNAARLNDVLCDDIAELLNGASDRLRLV